MAKEYEKLLNSYKRMFGMVNAIHFNSQNTAEVYAKYIIIPDESVVVPITHRGVNDCRFHRDFDHPVLRLGFIGSEAPYKGLPMLKRVIAKLNNEGFQDRIQLSVFGGREGADEILGNVEYKGRFGKNQMASVYEIMDLLVVPSICYETFGFTTIEAIQYGVPALVSSRVGSKDVVNQLAPHFVFNSVQDLYEILSRLIINREELEEYSEKILSSSWQWSMEKHAKDIVNQVYCINLDE